MAHEVFISYASADKRAAEDVCGAFEASAISCWIAPRDVKPGADFALSIVDAIRQARVLLLVLSAAANVSLHVKRELDRAVAAGLSILPVRLEDVEPAGPFEYYLAGAQWFEAVGGTSAERLDRLCVAAHELLGSDSAAAQTALRPAHRAQVSPPKTSQPQVPSDLSNGVPETRWARTVDGASIAYQYFGEGEVTLIVILGWISHLELCWEEPRFARFMRRLARNMRVLHFDKRGVGMSDRLSGAPGLDVQMDDVRAVLDAAGVERAAILGCGSCGPPLAAVFAATHPDRTLALCLHGSISFRRAPDFPWGLSEAEEEESLERLVSSWGDEEQAVAFVGEAFGERPEDAPVDDPAFLRRVARQARFAATPTSYAEFDRIWFETDARASLPTIHVPTAVLVKQDAEDWDRRHAEYNVTHIPGALLVEVPGAASCLWIEEPEPYVSAVERFLASVRSEEAALDRTLATVLFTDVVGSTDKACQMGDACWAELLAKRNATVRAFVARHRGVEIKTTGDGLLASFDGPARAVKCAQGICEAVKPLGLEVRAGCHTGEIELADDGVRGTTVEIGARVCALAGPSEVLVSSTVKDLVSGSGLAFVDRGEHELKGVPGSWRLYAAERAAG